VGNLIYDAATGNWGDFAADAASAVIPYVPAGLSKARKAKQCYVIGGNMQDRVIPFADKIGAKYFKPRSKNPANWLHNNKQWARKIKREGHDVIDIGPDPAVPNRPYYNAEDKIFAGYKGRTRVNVD